jgi:hypothetical protein
MRSTRRFKGALAAFLVVAGLLFSGCGDDSPNGPLTSGDEDVAVRPDNGGTNNDTSRQGLKGDGNQN